MTTSLPRRARSRCGGGNWAPDFQSKVVVCTDGKAGHHFRTREETGRIRLEEQLASARLGGYEFALLRLPTGEVPREACPAREYWVAGRPLEDHQGSSNPTICSAPLCRATPWPVCTWITWRWPRLSGQGGLHDQCSARLHPRVPIRRDGFQAMQGSSDCCGLRRLHVRR